MRVRRSQADLLYERIVTDVRTARHRLLILPARGVDALCACKILTTMLTTESVPHQVAPVSGFTDIAHAVDDFVEGQDGPSSIVLIDCGANIDLVAFLQLDTPSREQVTVYVIDSHRPLHLSNIDQSNRRVRVLMDDVDEETEFPDPLPADITEDGDIIDDSDEEVSQANAFDLDEYGDEEEEEGYDGYTSHEDADQEGDDEEEEESVDQNGDNDDDLYEGFSAEERKESDDIDSQDASHGSPLGHKRRRSKKKTTDGSRARNRVRRVAREKRESRSERRERYRTLIQQHRKYYERASFAPPIACLLFEMARRLSHETNNMLWWAILGLTDQFLLERISPDSYANQVTILYAVVNQLNDDAAAASARLSLAERQANDELIQITKRGHISFSQELKLNLLRHWTVYDSMYHSREIAAALQTWSAKGESDLKIILAKMGIPLTEAKRPYAVLDEEFKSALMRGIDSYSSVEGLKVLESLKYESFVRQHAASFVTSAADAVLGLNAILDASPSALDSILAVAQAGSLTSVTASGAAATATSAPASSLATLMSSSGATTVGSVTAGSNESGSRNNQPTGATGQGAEQILAHQRATAQRLKQQFWLASDALESRSVELLRRGIELQIQTLRAVVNQGVAMHQKGDIDTRSYVHLAVVDNAPDLEWFKQPAALARLVFFLQDLVAMRRQSRPMLGAVLLQETGEYLIVGANAIRGGVTRQGANSFGAAFRLAAERIGVPVRHEGFDTSTLQLPKDALQPFFKQLIIVVSGLISLNTV